MRLIKHTVLALLGLGLLSAVSQAQDHDFEQVEIQSIPVAEDIYMLVGEGSNMGVSAGDDGVFLIDDFPEADVLHAGNVYSGRSFTKVWFSSTELD